MNFLINWGKNLLCDKFSHIQTWQWFQLFLDSLLSAIALLSSVRWLSPLFIVIPGAYQMNRPLPSSKNPHFRNEARCTTFLVNMSFIAWEWKMISISKAEHLPLFWNRGPGELGNGLFEHKTNPVLYTRKYIRHVKNVPNFFPTATRSRGFNHRVQISFGGCNWSPHEEK